MSRLKKYARCAPAPLKGACFAFQKWNSKDELAKHVDEDEKLVGTLFRSGQNREVWFLTENGLYEVLMQSRKPLAKEFKKEVKAILKSIRKHGMFATDELLDNPDFAIATLQKLKEAQK